MRSSPVPVSPILEACTLVGRVGMSQGLYLQIHLDGHPVRALIDTGSTITLVQPGVLPGTASTFPASWTPVSAAFTTVTGGKASMRATKEVRFQVGAEERMHPCWLANITDPCIVGLDLLQRWGARVDVPNTTIQLGAETRGLQLGREEKSATQVRGVKRRKKPPPRVARGVVTSALLRDCAPLGQPLRAAPAGGEVGRIAPLSTEEHQRHTGFAQGSHRREGMASTPRPKNVFADEPTQAYRASQRPNRLATSAAGRRNPKVVQVRPPNALSLSPACPTPGAPHLPSRTPGTCNDKREGNLPLSRQRTSPIPPETVEVLQGLLAQSRADLTRPQAEQLRALLWENWDIFAVKEQD